MNELLAKIAALSKQVEGINAKQTAALTASQKDGISAEDAKKHTDEFDRLQAEKEPIEAQARDLQARVNKLSATTSFLVEPSRSGIAPAPYTPPGTGSAETAVIPARARRHGPLRAFRGRERDAYAAGLFYASVFTAAHPADFEYGRQLQARARTFGIDMTPGSGGEPQANLTGLSNQSGGFFVPEIIDMTIVEVSQDYGVLRRLAEVVSMASETQTSPRWSAAMTAYWIGRGQKPTSSDPAWNAVQLVAKELGAMTKIAKQINEDSLVDLGEKVTVNIARAFAIAEDNAGFNGDGTSTYGGISGILTALALTANANCVVTATGHTTVPALTNADFLKLTGQYPNYAGANPGWLCHKQVWSQSMAALQLAGGGNRVDEIAGGGRKEFLGYPVEFVNVMPNAPTTGQIAIVFGDLSLGVKVGDRRGRTVQAGYENDDFTKQLVTILGTERVDVNVHTVVDPLGDTKVTGGPIMCLKLG